MFKHKQTFEMDDYRITLESLGESGDPYSVAVTCISVPSIVYYVELIASGDGAELRFKGLAHRLKKLCESGHPENFERGMDTLSEFQANHIGISLAELWELLGRA